jgi:hypothetical protein
MVSSEYTSAIAGLRDRLASEPSDPKIVHLAKKLGSLPKEGLYVGEFKGGGLYLLLFLHPDGRLLAFNVLFDELDEYDAATERDWGLKIGSKRYPELAAWISPKPAEGAVPCPVCGGSGWDPELPGESACADCNGRGWQDAVALAEAASVP